MGKIRLRRDLWINQDGKPKPRSPSRRAEKKYTKYNEPRTLEITDKYQKLTNHDQNKPQETLQKHPIKNEEIKSTP